MRKAFFILVSLAGAFSSCKKKPVDPLTRLAGVWHCIGDNNSSYHDFASHFDTLIPFTRDVVVTYINGMLSIEAGYGFDMYRKFIDMGRSYSKSDLDDPYSNDLYFRNGHTNSMTGQGLSVTLRYNSVTDEISYSYYDHNNSNMFSSLSLTGKRK